MLISLGISALHLLGIASALHAIWHVRSSQGAIAWAISLTIFPYVTLPFYWVFGRKNFHGYTDLVAQAETTDGTRLTQLQPRLAQSEFAISLPQDMANFEVLATLADSAFTSGNKLDLLINGDATFDALFKSIEQARTYILMQFFIIQDDSLGETLLKCLQAKVAQGISVKVLYDEVGSHSISSGFLTKMRDAGIDIKAFHSAQGRRNHFQLNFRNHRKITVIDGNVGFTGGLNLGNEYRGLGPLGHWRDTHLKLEGPCVQALQLSFAADWYWACRETLALSWHITPAGDTTALIYPTGPADKLDACAMMFHQAIVAAKQRVWIASPYFVPSTAILEALQLAALRGVDVRILLPAKPDHKLVYLASFSFLAAADRAGIQIFRYQQGFLHQKVFLVDDKLAAVGSANLDNRSLHLNFEVMAIVADRRFAHRVSNMLEQDFAHSKSITHHDLQIRPWWFRLAVKVARLLDPIL